jgi:hypothetical protein
VRAAVRRIVRHALCREGVAGGCRRIAAVRRVLEQQLARPGPAGGAVASSGQGLARARRRSW